MKIPFRARLALPLLTLGLVSCGSWLSREDYSKDIRLGREASMEVALNMGIANDPVRTEYVQAIGKRLADGIPDSKVPFYFRIVDASELNGFSLPGGHIYVTRGIIATANSEAELAAILAHEMAHVVERHSVRQMYRDAPSNILKIPGNVAGSIFGDGVGGLINAPVNLITGLNLSRYSRKLEREADDYGMQLLATAGYDPKAMGVFVGHLSQVDSVMSGTQEKRDYFSSHPYTPDRVAGIYKTATGIPFTPRPPLAPDYLRKIDGLTFGEDPSQGVLRDNVFLTPRHNFKVTLPPGWESFRSGGGLLSTSSDGTALLAVTPDSTKEAPTAIGKRFVASLRERFGIEPYQARAIRKAGFDSYLVSLQDTSGPQPAYLHLYWLRTGTRTSLILAMGAESHRPELRTAAESIRRLTSAERSKFHVDVVTTSTLRSGESLADFDQRTGNQWPGDLTAAMNALAPDTPLANRRLKYLKRRSLR